MSMIERRLTRLETLSGRTDRRIVVLSAPDGMSDDDTLSFIEGEGVTPHDGDLLIYVRSFLDVDDSAASKIHMMKPR